MLADSFAKYNVETLKISRFNTASLNKLLQALSSYNKLQSLTLTNVRLDIVSAKYLENVIANNLKLKSLDLQFIGVNDDVLAKFSKGFKGDREEAASTKRSEIEQLNLWGNEITENGVVALINNLSKNNSLKKLYLGFNNITDAGMVDIIKFIRNNDSLEFLDLTRNPLTDASALLFAEFMKNNKDMKIKKNNFEINFIYKGNKSTEKGFS